MGYLDNSSITVDAVLTKKGREILKNGGTLTTNSDGTQTLNPSSLNITSFTLSDTGVDYTLWNPTHPSGSDNYGEAIENLPQLEASVHAEYNLRNRLITLGQSATALPAIQISGLDSAGGTTLTFGTSESETQGVATINVDILGLPDPSTIFDALNVILEAPSLYVALKSLTPTIVGKSLVLISEASSAMLFPVS